MNRITALSIQIAIFLSMSAQPCWAQDKLKSSVSKEGQSVPAGWTCYDPASLVTIDAAQKRGIDCLIQLKKAESKIQLLESKIPDPNFKVEQQAQAKWYDATWFKVTVGGGLVLLGFAVGKSF